MIKSILCYTLLSFFLYTVYFLVKTRLKRMPRSIGILHPYCNSGGGGERVLWTAVKSIQNDSPNLRLYIYSGGSEDLTEILAKVSAIFGISISPTNLNLIHLSRIKYIEASSYPVATLFFQFLGSIFLMHEALSYQAVETLLDTHGQPFGYFLAKLSGIKVVAYVHYPLISLDMIQKVREMRPSYNNSSGIASRASVSSLKVWYYYLLMKWYSSVGWFCDLAYCNSSWTANHIRGLWRCRCVILYPPCDVSNFLKLGMNTKDRIAISIGQFRPEKDHLLQIKAFQVLLTDHPELKDARLMLVGSCRDEDDLNRVKNLKIKAKELGIEENVEFHTNVQYSQLMALLSRAAIGLHTMWNEHFGICVVELMASGLVTIAHNSAGPKEDIVTHADDGFLATTAQEYADLMFQVFSDLNSFDGLRKNARAKAKQFSNENFSRGFQQDFNRFCS